MLNKGVLLLLGVFPLVFVKPVYAGIESNLVFHINLNNDSFLSSPLGIQFSENNDVLIENGLINGSTAFTPASGSSLYSYDSRLNLSDRDITICGWVNIYDDSITQNFFGRAGSSPNRSFAVSLNTTTKGINLGYSNNGTTLNVITTTQTITTDSWNFICAWHDSVNNSVGIQINDQTPATAGYTSGLYNNSSVPFAIGSSSSFTNETAGKIDEVYFFNRILTANEKTQLYNYGNGYSLIIPDCSTDLECSQRILEVEKKQLSILYAITVLFGIIFVLWVVNEILKGMLLSWRS